ncbi:MAG: hypothetical protein GDA38_08280 [Hormoscilla sp. SP12CHS1]|nr:hypothetical protein [Hormoscilla sp. SP12CHS1]
MFIAQVLFLNLWKYALGIGSDLSGTVGDRVKVSNSKYRLIRLVMSAKILFCLGLDASS